MPPQCLKAVLMICYFLFQVFQKHDALLECCIMSGSISDLINCCDRNADYSIAPRKIKDKEGMLLLSGCRFFRGVQEKKDEQQ